MSAATPVNKDHVVIVAWYRDSKDDLFMLIGQETEYSGYEPIPDAKDRESEIEEIKKLLKLGQRYVIRQKGEIRKWTRQVSGTASKFGFPKGGVKVKDGGDFKEAAKREFEEEIGHGIDKRRLVDHGVIVDSHVYTYHVNTPEEIEAITKAIIKQKQEKKGELFFVAFKSAKAIQAEIDTAKYNSKTRAVFKALISRPGFEIPKSPPKLYVPPGKRGGRFRKTQRHKNKTRRRGTIKRAKHTA